MKDKCIDILDKLLTGSNSSDEQIISGYNYYPKIAYFENCKILTFSNMHETQDYFAFMMRDLLAYGYPNDGVLMQLRDKYGVYRWELDFNFRNDEGEVYPDLKIKNIKSGKYIDLIQIIPTTLEEAGYAKKEAKNLIGENKGWEINIGCDKIEDIIEIANLFTKKAYKFPFNKYGIFLPETEEEKDIRKPWADAYETPVLIIGGDIVQIKDKISSFIPAKLIRWQKENAELNFIVNNAFEKLKNLSEYQDLINLGFKEEDCLANLPFILQYVDQ